MKRELYITVHDTKDVTVRNEILADTDFLGYYGEDEATELMIWLPTDWTGSFYLDWKATEDDDFTESTTEYTDTEITYDVPTEILVVGDVYLRIRVEDGSTVMFVDPIRFVVKP